MCSVLFRLTVLTSFDSLTIRTELDFKSEYLFRMCSVVTNLVTSLEFQPIRCATTLFHFGRKRNVYVATRIILLSSTAESSATSGYVVAPDRSGKIEAWASRKAERAKKRPSLFPTVILIKAACKYEPFQHLYTFFPYFKLFFHSILVFSSYGNSFDLLFMSLFEAREQPLWSPFPADRTCNFSVERWKKRGPWRTKWTENCLFPARVGIFPFINNMIKVLFPNYTLIWRVNSYVSHQGTV